MKKIISRILIVALLASLLMTAVGTAALAATKIYITGDSVYVRKGPGKTYDTRGTVHYGEAYNANASSNDERGVKWYKISFKGKDGWVSSKYASTTAPGGKDYGRIYATGGSTYVRAAANKTAKILTTLSKGASAEYLGVKQKDGRGVYWYKVSYKGNTGWVSEKYTSTTSGSQSYGKVVATGGSTYIRSNADKTATIITSVSKGASVAYLGEYKKDGRGVKWYKVRTDSGKTGWVSEKYTTLKK